MAKLDTQRGFCLIEVLVALSILSIGMLGVSALFVKGLRTSNAAALRLHAIMLAGDVADRVRANPDAGLAYESAASQSNCVFDRRICDAVAVARDDIGMWQQQAQAVLPDGSVSVSIHENTEPRVVEIIITWREPGARGHTRFSLNIAILRNTTVNHVSTY